jgi:hypothetical protein
MDLKASIVNGAFFLALGALGWWVFDTLTDRTDEIVLSGDTTSGLVVFQDVACRRGFRSVRIQYVAGGREHERSDKVECGWEVPNQVTVAYLPSRPEEGRLLDPLRTRRRTNAGR